MAHLLYTILVVPIDFILMDIETLKNKLGLRPVRFYEKTGSTNTDAINWLTEEPDVLSGAVVITNEQESGKGRFNRKWITPPDTAIAMSTIIKGEINAQRLAMAAGLSIIDALQPLVKNHVSLKWPNDVLLDNKKVCGCLIERVNKPENIQAAIVGIGINVSVDFDNTDLSNKATNLSFHSEQIINRVELIYQVLDRLDYWIHSDNIFTSWKSNLSTIGEKIQVVTLNEKLNGLALDVKQNGALLLKMESGEIRELLAGDVSITYK